MDNDTEVPEECSQEMKSKKATHSLVADNAKTLKSANKIIQHTQRSRGEETIR